MKEILLSQEKVAVVDDKNFAWLSRWIWSAEKREKTWYAVRFEGRYPNQKKIYMHRQIIQAPKGVEVDHKDRNGLHNWEENLRVCTGTDNRHNTSAHKNSKSGFKGVGWSKLRNEYQSRIMVNGKYIFLGWHKDPVDAAKAYDKAAKEHYGEYAVLNFPNTN